MALSPPAAAADRSYMAAGIEVSLVLHDLLNQSLTDFAFGASLKTSSHQTLDYCGAPHDFLLPGGRTGRVPGKGLAKRGSIPVRETRNPSQQTLL
jgi:hypothetical protein